MLAYARDQKTTGLLIIQNRRVIAEHNWPLAPDATGFRAAFVHGQASDGSLLEDVASQQKSFIAILIGVRTGQTTPARDFNQQLWLRLTKALPVGE